MKKIFIINGSASANSSNHKLIENFAELAKGFFEVTSSNDLKTLPHFDPQLSASDPPEAIVEFRSGIEKADAVLICTPEYIFSIPSGLKNAIEWCVSTTVFSDKPVGLITASAYGEKGQEELTLIMKTLSAKFTSETTLLIQGMKGKVNSQGEIIHDETWSKLVKFVDAFRLLVGEGR